MQDSEYTLLVLESCSISCGDATRFMSRSETTETAKTALSASRFEDWSIISAALHE